MGAVGGGCGDRVVEGAAGTARDLEKQFGGKFEDAAGYGDIKQRLVDAGKGAQVIVSRATFGGKAHVYNGYVDDLGLVKFVDGQSGKSVKIWPSSSQASYRFLWVNKP